MNFEGCAVRTITRAAVFAFVSCLLALVPVISGNVAQAASKTTEVTIDAKVGVEGKPITEAVVWTITKLDKNGKPVKDPSVEETSPVLKTKLKAGQYQVIARTKDMAAKQVFTVAKEPVTRTVIFGLAEINIKMITSKGRKPVKDPIQWLMLTYVKGDADKGKEVANVTGPTASFTVPAGGYVVRANYKGVTADLVVPLKAGQSYDYTLNLYAGYGEPSAFKGKEKIEQDVVWRVVREKPNEKGEYQLVTEQHAAEPVIMLREGKYILIAQFGKMWGQEKLYITAGEVEKVKVKLKEEVGMPVIAQR
jgi:hypothetical protein